MEGACSSGLGKIVRRMGPFAECSFFIISSVNQSYIYVLSKASEAAGLAASVPFPLPVSPGTAEEGGRGQEGQ